MLSFIIPSTKSQPRFWWGKTGQISGYSPGSQFPILLVQSLLEAPLSQTDLTSSPIWTLHFHKCHNNEAGGEVFKVFIRTGLVADRKWVETRFVYSFFLIVTSLMLNISANMFCTFIYPACARSARARRACPLADGAPTVGRGKTFWQVSRIFLRKQL